MCGRRHSSCTVQGTHSEEDHTFITITAHTHTHTASCLSPYLCLTPSSLLFCFSLSHTHIYILHKIHTDVDSCALLWEKSKTDKRWCFGGESLFSIYILVQCSEGDKSTSCHLGGMLSQHGRSCCFSDDIFSSISIVSEPWWLLLAYWLFERQPLLDCVTLFWC